MAVIEGAGGKYGKYIMQELHDPNPGTPEFQEMYKKFSHRILWIDDKLVPGSMQMNTAWFYAVPERDPVFEEHVHDDDELVGFFSSDPDNPNDLDAELTFTIDGEEHLITKSTIIFLPGGLPHGQIRIKRVGRPIFHFSLMRGGEYNNGAYDMGDED
ncbi:MAG: hypothetical protein ACOYIK_10850 [Coriobacteriales bacterium]|jgi:hypothetical protein